MKTVLHISHLPYYYQEMPGSGLPPLFHCVREFVRRGWRTMFCYPSDKPMKPYEMEGIEFYPIYFPPMARKTGPSSQFWRWVVRLGLPFYTVYFAIRLVPLCLRFKPTLIYAHEPPSIMAGKLVQLYTRRPLIGRIYGFEASPERLMQHMPPLTFGGISTWAALRLGAQLYVITDDGTRAQEVVNEIGISEKSLVLKSGVDVPEVLTESSRLEIREQLSLGRQPLITFVAWFEGWKRTERVLRVAKESYKLGKGWRFLLIGGGAQLEIIRRQIEESGLEGVVTLTGPKPHPDVLEHVFASDVFLSLHDLSSLSNTLLEAVSLGTPVVCSNLGHGIDSVVIQGQNGFLVEDPNDTKEVISKLESALQLGPVPEDKIIKLDSWQERMDKEFAQFERLGWV